MTDSKRQILYSTVLSASLLTGCASFEAPDEPVIEEHKYSNFIQTLGFLCEDSTYILLGDSDHTSMAITELISDPDVLQAIKNCNRPLYLESGIEENEAYEVGAIRPQRSRTQRMIYQDFQSGVSQFTGEEYLDAPNYEQNTDQQKNNQNRLRLLYNAAQLGVPILYPDIRYADIEADAELNNAFNWIYQKYYDYNVEDTQGETNFTIELDAYFNKNIEVRPSGVALQTIFDLSVSEEVNQAIVTNIKTLNDGDPAIIMYGAGHMQQDYDFDEMLGAERTITIYLKADSDHVVWSDPMNAGTADVVSDNPEYIYDIGANHMIEVNKNDPENGFRQMIQYGYTPEQYQIAVDSLPDDLKPYALPYSEYDDTEKNDQIPEDWLETDQHYINPDYPVIGDPEL